MYLIYGLATHSSPQTPSQSSISGLEEGNHFDGMEEGDEREGIQVSSRWTDYEEEEDSEAEVEEEKSETEEEELEIEYEEDRSEDDLAPGRCKCILFFMYSPHVTCSRKPTLTGALFS